MSPLEACIRCGAPKPVRESCPRCGSIEPMRATSELQAPRPPRRACLRCGTPTSGSYCPTHQRERDAAKHARQEAHGRNTPEWRELSRARRALAGCCELRVDQRCTGQAETAHLRPDFEGDHFSATINDVRAACRHCHGVVDAPRAQDARR